MNPDTNTSSRLGGLHHVTAVTGDAPRNVEFYTRVLGMRLVKKTVNQDDVAAYHLFYGDEEGIARVGATVPLGRMGNPDDVADACLYLSSPLARYVSGANLVVHGGGERPTYLDASNAEQAPT